MLARQQARREAGGSNRLPPKEGQLSVNEALKALAEKRREEMKTAAAKSEGDDVAELENDEDATEVI